jgi:hypothetical protein
MRQLPLTVSGAAAVLGLLAATAQAQPVTLSVRQMDELTAGHAAATSAATITIAAPQGAVTATLAVSTSASDSQGYIDVCQNAISESISSPNGTFALTVSCVCDGAATESASR